MDQWSSIIKSLVLVSFLASTLCSFQWWSGLLGLPHWLLTGMLFNKQHSVVSRWMPDSTLSRTQESLSLKTPVCGDSLAASLGGRIRTEACLLKDPAHNSSADQLGSLILQALMLNSLFTNTKFSSLSLSDWRKKKKKKTKAKSIYKWKRNPREQHFGVYPIGTRFSVGVLCAGVSPGGGCRSSCAWSCCSEFLVFCCPKISGKWYVTDINCDY